MKEFGLKHSPEKCQSLRTSVKFLGHVMSANEVEIDPTKIAALMTWPRPNNIKDLKSFLEFARYYWRFIKDYSKVTQRAGGRGACMNADLRQWQCVCLSTSFVNLILSLETYDRLYNMWKLCLTIR